MAIKTGLTHQTTGKQMSTEEAHAAIAETIKRCGRFILAAPIAPTLGEIQSFAGLPMRAVRYVTFEEYKNDSDASLDIWGVLSPGQGDDSFFEVEVAD